MPLVFYIEPLTPSAQPHQKLREPSGKKYLLVPTVERRNLAVPRGCRVGMP